jgi:hypothetical protein
MDTKNTDNNTNRRRKRAASSLESQQQKEAPVDTTTYEAFVTAANAISHLYSHSVKRLEEERKLGARNALQRLEACLPSSNAEESSIPTSELRKYIAEELHKIDMDR